MARDVSFGSAILSTSGQFFFLSTSGQLSFDLGSIFFLSTSGPFDFRKLPVLASLPQLQLVEVPHEVSTENVAGVINELKIRRAYDGSWEGIVTVWERVGLCTVHADIEFWKEKLNAADEQGEAAMPTPRFAQSYHM